MRRLRDGWFIVQAGITAIPAWFALVLWVPPATFPTSPSYDLMESLAHEWAWACISAALAAVGFASLLLGAGTRRRLLLHRCAAGALSLFHGTVALCIGVANPASTGTGTYLVLALLAYALMMERTHT